jgi:hypothetical protein
MSALHKRGVAGAVICSDPFRKLAETQRKVLGAPDMPLIMIPHPLGGLSMEQVAGRAEIAAPQVIELVKTFAG